MKTFRRTMFTALATAATLMLSAPSNAVTQLGFILDRSGSIGSSNWSIIVNGLANAIKTLVPADSSYEISVVSFAGSSAINVNHVLIDSVATRDSVAATIQAIPWTAGTTNLAAGIESMTLALTSSTLGATMSYVNLATDGVADSNSAAVAARNVMTASGIDNISIEAIGSGVDAAFLQNSICYPGPCDITVPYDNFPAQGFYIAVADANGYAAAIGNKIQIVTGVPEPGTLALLGLGLLGLGATRRRAH